MGEKRGGSECKKRMQSGRILTQEKCFKENRERERERERKEGKINATGWENKVNMNEGRR
jgi:hypothetical protein